MHGRLDNLDAHNASSMSDLSPEDHDEDSDDPTGASTTQFSLGSKQAIKSFTAIESSNAGNPAFNQFQDKLNGFLNHAFVANDIPLPDGREINLGAGEVVSQPILNLF
jgi:hypothetical protein